jgi:polo-like kinase 1
MSEKDKDKEKAAENQSIIEEKITKGNGEVQIKKYIKGRLLGKGGFAKCYEFINQETQHSSAAKIIPKKSLVKSRAKQKLISEIKIHKSLHHPNIVAFEHYFEDSENVYLLIEICLNQTLNELLKRRKKLTELEVQCYAVQIIKALKYLHTHRVIHRDLKLGNLFISDKMEIKVGDFGLATKLEFDGERKRTVCGTPNYIAPEILEGKAGHSYEVDIWSLGVIMYTLIIGKPPFETNNVKETYKRIKSGNYSFPEHAIISEPAKDLIQSILVLDPYKRPKLDEILAHDFFNMGVSIPKTMQQSTLACPPSLNYIKQYIPNVGPNGIVVNYVKKSKPPSESQTNDFDLGHGHTHKDNRPYTSNYGMQETKDGLLKKGSDNLAEVSVKKWIDYSSKYGLGYILSNGHIGVYFNDSTKIIYRPNGANFIYIERNSQEKTEIITSHVFNEEFPKDLNKKVILLQHFKAYLLEENKNTPIERKESENIDEKHYVYVKKWMKTKHAILFRLSNKIVQVSFLDQTEIILSSETKIVTYMDKKGQLTSYPLNTALDSSNNEMTKRLKYTKQILMHMLTSKTHSGGQQASGSMTSTTMKHSQNQGNHQ